MANGCVCITLGIILSLVIVYVTNNISNTDHQSKVEEYMNTQKVMRNELKKVSDSLHNANEKISRLEKDKGKMAQILKTSQSNLNQASIDLKNANAKISTLETKLRDEIDEDIRNKKELSDKIQQAEYLIADLKKVILTNNITLNN